MMLQDERMFDLMRRAVKGPLDKELVVRFEVLRANQRLEEVCCFSPRHWWVGVRAMSRLDLKKKILIL